MKLTEKYIANQILKNYVIAFLEENIQGDAKPTITSLLEQYSGKTRNTIYKNLNQIQVYSAPSFIRYWHSLEGICEEYQIPKEKWPTLRDIYVVYEDFFELLSYLSLEDCLEKVLNIYLESVVDIVKFYSHKKKQLTEKQLELLKQIEASPTVIEVFQLDKEKALKIQRERMETINERT